MSFKNIFGTSKGEAKPQKIPLKMSTENSGPT